MTRGGRGPPAGLLWGGGRGLMGGLTAKRKCKQLDSESQG